MEKSEAQNVLVAISKGEPSGYWLVPHSTVNESSGKSKKRSPYYKGWLLLCRNGTHEDVGFLVCPYYASNCDDPVRKYDPRRGGTNSLAAHMSKHEDRDKKRRNTALVVPKVVNQAHKSHIARAAAMVCYMDLFPLSWTNNHEGIERFALSVFSAGTAMMPGQTVNVKDFLPCSNTVRSKVLELEAEEREQDKNTRLKEAFEIGGAMSCDGLKQKHTGTKVFDLTLHFFYAASITISDASASLISERKRVTKLKLISRTLFVSPLPATSGESALSIRSLLNNMCLTYTGIPFAQFKDHFTLVSDCAATMPNIVGSSVSANVAPLDHLWVGCIPHQMNTIMKTTFSKERLQAAQLVSVWNNLEAMRDIVRHFKQGGWNSELQNGKALISEIETRFGLVHATCTRFLHACTDVYLLIEKKNNLSAKGYWKKLDSEVGVAQSSIVLPTIQAIVDVCEPLVEIMVQMQASKHPTIHIVAPRLLHATNYLTRVSNGSEIRNSSGTSRLPSATTMKLAKLTLEVIKEKLLCHPIYVGSILLHPLLATFSWVPDAPTREEYFKAAESYVRKVMEKTTSSTSCEPCESLSARTPSHTDRESFSLEDYFMAEESSSTFAQSDELKSYIARLNDRSLLSAEEEKALRSDKEMGMVHYWYNNTKYPRLRAVALRTFATPASSCESERVFSAANKIQTKDRSRLDPKVQCALIYLRSLHLSEKASRS